MDTNKPECPFIAWIDLETTGLDTEHDDILEVAAVITNEKLDVIQSYHALVEVNLDYIRMNEWCWKQHTESGLLQELRESRSQQSYTTIDLSLDSMITWNCVIFNEANREKIHYKPPLGGANVGAFDRRFIQRCFPRCARALSHRHVDVSTLREVARRFWPDLVLPEKSEKHRAMPDIVASIECARAFRNALIMHPDPE